MRKVTLSITDINYEQLTKMSNETGLSQSELIRRMIDEHYEKYDGKKKMVEEFNAIQAGIIQTTIV